MFVSGCQFMENRRLIIVLASDEANQISPDDVQTELVSLGIDNIRRSEDSGPVVVTGTVPAETDVPALLQTLNGMPAVRSAEEDSWTFSQ